MTLHSLVRQSPFAGRPHVLLLAGITVLAAVALTGCGGAGHKSASSTARIPGPALAGGTGAGAGAPGFGEDAAAGLPAPAAAASAAGTPPGATSTAAGSAAAAATGSLPAGKVVAALQSRDIVRTATLSVEVADVDKAADSLNAATAKLGGRVDQDNRSDRPTRSAQLVLRLDPRTLDTAMATADRLGTETARTVKGDDVTASHADVNARVAALRTSVGRLQALLGSSANLNDLVSLEAQLTQRQATLDSTVAQQRALSDEISLATLTVNLATRPVVVVAKPHTSGRHLAAFGSAFGSGGRGLATAVRFVLAGLGYALPFLGVALIAAGALYGARFGWRRLRRNHTELAGAQDS